MRRCRLDADRVLAQVGFARAHDLHHVIAGRGCHVVDDVVAAIGSVAGCSGDQVTARVVEIDRRIKIVSELEAAGAWDSRAWSS